MKTKKQYGLLTCIAMIVGVVIGSGIFFKSDNILVATNGNIFLGCLAFIVAAISIIFGSLTIAELAARTDKAGGIITYAEDAYGRNIACAFGWFQLFLYYPTTLAIVCYVVGMYTCMLFGISGTLLTQMSIGLLVALLLAGLNIFSKKLAGYFQTAATFIKLIPLVLIGILGFVFGNPSDSLEVTSSDVMSGTWISALIPIVFAFDGWMVSTSISHEVKNAKKNIPLALISAPLAILAIYLVYFIGISVYLGPEVIMSTGDNHVELAASQLLGPWAAKGVLIFIIISVAGTANGFMGGLFQLPYLLAIRNMIPYSEQIAKVNNKYDRSILSCVIGGVIVVFWIFVHYITQTYELLPNSDISEIAVTLNYVLLIGLYYHVFKLSCTGEIKGFFKGKFNPIMAMLGSLIILYVGFQNKLFIVYIVICACLLFTGYLYSKRTEISLNNSSLIED